jgi:hypothetical protein
MLMLRGSWQPDISRDLKHWILHFNVFPGLKAEDFSTGPKRLGEIHGEGEPLP